MSNSSRPLVMTLILTLSACGDGDGEERDAATDAQAVDAATDAHVTTAADYEGMWLITSLTIPSQGTLVTLLRDGDPQSIRGDAMFVATGDQTATLDGRQVLLYGGVMASEVSTGLNQVTVEADRWLLTDSSEDVSVFLTSLEGDHLVLSWDGADPRNTAVSPPTSIVVDRVPAWTSTVVGSWELVSIQLPSGTIEANACIEVQAGTTWATVRMDITFDPRLLFERLMTSTRYSDEQCTAQIDEQTSLQTGFAEEEANTTVRLWGRENGNPEYQVFSIDVAGDVATLTRTACLPLPDCEAEAPTSVVVRRVP